MKCKKVQYKTKAEAKQRSKKIRKLLGGKKKRAYACQWCCNWHLTTQPLKLFGVSYEK